MYKFTLYIIFFLFLSLSEISFGQENIPLSTNAQLENSILLLKELRKEIPADSLVDWIQQEGNSGTSILCHLDTLGGLLGFIEYKTRKVVPTFLSYNGDKIKRILIKKRPKFVFGCEIISDTQKEIYLRKKYIVETYQKRGYLWETIPLFYPSFRTIILMIRKEYELRNVEITTDECLDILFERYTPEHY